MSDHETTGGETWDATATPSVYTPTVLSQLAAALGNAAYLKEIKVDGVMGAAHSGMALDKIALVPFANFAVGISDGGGRALRLIEPTGGAGYGDTNVGDLDTALLNRWIIMFVGGIKIGNDLGTTMPGIGIDLSTQSDHLLTGSGTARIKNLFAFYSGSGQAAPTSGDGDNRCEVYWKNYTETAEDTLIFYVNSGDGSLRAYYPTATQMAIVGAALILPKVT